MREHPLDLESIVQTKFSRIKSKQADKAKYYEDLEAELSTRIGDAWDNNPDFGYKESDDVVVAFVKEKRMSELFSDVPTLSCTDEELLDFSVQDVTSDYLTE